MLYDIWLVIDNYWSRQYWPVVGSVNTKSHKWRHLFGNAILGSSSSPVLYRLVVISRYKHLNRNQTPPRTCCDMNQGTKLTWPRDRTSATLGEHSCRVVFWFNVGSGLVRFLPIQTGIGKMDIWLWADRWEYGIPGFWLQSSGLLRLQFVVELSTVEDPGWSPRGLPSLSVRWYQV